VFRSRSRSPEQCRAKALKDLRESARPKEAMERGEVKTHVYKEYISAASVVGVAAFLFATFASQGASIAGNL
jgi:ATP-binding cassette subfamily C (CFTR/MRP) protein 1